MAEIKYEIVERIAVLGERPRGWERQLNLISWNDGDPKYLAAPSPNYGANRPF